MNKDYFKYNDTVLRKMSIFLNYESDFITEEIIRELTQEFSMSKEEAFRYVLAAAVGIDVEENAEHRKIFELYFPLMVRELDASDYEKNTYLQKIKFKEQKRGKWEFRYMTYKPYEAFVCDDLLTLSDGRIIPQIGFFDREYRYPCVLENGREWMFITPNEINTMKEPISQAFGSVLTYGLGLGYFAFMCSEKADVDSVTVIERDKNAIELFENCIRPYIPNSQKINIICADALEYAQKEVPKGNFDFIFADIWHDAGDGAELYKKFKSLEHLSPKTVFAYWIEKTLKVYL